ncbi:hypothetical protein [Lachnospira multipara]|uniref:hypothetical protein n=1 Tax=Lachnospira multipara TaxID=28051 RepID=UPI0004E17E5C|nr:hypothetical protein [Lachnospira multipara]
MKSINRFIYPVVFLILIIITNIIFMDSQTTFLQYINIVAIAFMLVTTLCLQLLTGDLNYFFNSLVNTKDNRNLKLKSIKHTMTIWLLSGILYSLLSLIDIMHVDGVLIDNIAMSLNPILYGIIGIIILYPSKIFFEDITSES